MENKLKSLGISELEKFNIDRASGIYFLFNLGELVYIGKAQDVYIRIAIHRKNEMVFDTAKIFRVENIEKRDLLEIKLIWEFKPSYNIFIINPKVYLKNKMKPKYQVCTIGLDNDDKNK